MPKSRSPFYSLLFAGLIGVSLCMAAGAFSAEALSKGYERAERVLYALQIYERWMVIALDSTIKRGEQKDLAIAEAVEDLTGLQKEIDKLEVELQALRQRGEVTVYREILLEALLFAKDQWQQRLHALETGITSLKRLKARIQALEGELMSALDALAREGGDVGGDSGAATLQRLDELAGTGEAMLVEVQKLFTTPAA